ncbi:sigmaY antisigma factor component [Bacillus sp. REN16]|uniref:sigmaY antisigma factor component n=1 Tax=Bacillus sp. REN16 TaxID=2887296 RepID=UPI001E4547B1|nr:sigmaY antisigma factor component [Bacillus sp. REN16]MCC3355391.1 sigmaY antisigma factor component [Bacillus sp. REN16]
MNTNHDLLFIVVVIIVLIQGLWLFLDARKRGHNYWFWGIWGLIQTPLPLILYLIFARKIYRRGADRE